MTETSGLNIIQKSCSDSLEKTEDEIRQQFEEEFLKPIINQLIDNAEMANYRVSGNQGQECLK